jgi:hypothetical protein
MTFNDKVRQETRKQIMWGLGWIARDAMSKSEPKRKKKRTIVVSKDDANRIHAARWKYFTTGVKQIVTITPLNRKKL